MTAPDTKSEIERALRNDCATSGDGYVDVGDAAYMVERWRSEWLANAEPRLRPVSEKPGMGDLIAAIPPDGRIGAVFRYSGHPFSAECASWVLIERAKPKTLAQEARELLTRYPRFCEGGSVAGSVLPADAAALLRRVAEQEKRDE